jgi:hypothetical protein
VPVETLNEEEEGEENDKIRYRKIRDEG